MPSAVTEVLAQINLAGEIVEWRGPAPFLFVAIPLVHVGELRYAACEASYGWGCIPASAKIGATSFSTSLFPRGDTYMLPVKVAVQRAEAIGLGDQVEAMLEIIRR